MKQSEEGEKNLTQKKYFLEIIFPFKVSYKGSSSIKLNFFFWLSNNALTRALTFKK